MANSAGEGGGAKRLREGEQGDRCEALGADVPVDRISVLPDELRLRILARLTYKAAIRTGALASGWRDLWRSRWTHRASVEVYLGRDAVARRELDVLEREPRPCRRLNRFSLVAETCKLNNLELKRFLEYAAECHAEDLQIGSQVAQEFNKALPDDLSALTVLTICNNALPVASSLHDDGATTKLPKLHNLHGLRELHLLMFKMEDANLADIYVFLKNCKCHNLERLFVQLGYVCGSTKGSLDMVPEEPPEDGLDNLAMVKVKNFNWRCAEVQLVSFLLRKAKSLRKLLIVSENVSPLDVPGVQEAELLFLKEALANGKIMLSKSDDAAPHPYHSAFIDNF